MFVCLSGCQEKKLVFLFSAWELENTTIRINIVKQGESDGLELTEAILQCVLESFVQGCTLLYLCLNFIC